MDNDTFLKLLTSYVEQILALSGDDAINSSMYYKLANEKRVEEALEVARHLNGIARNPSINLPDSWGDWGEYHFLELADLHDGKFRSYALYNKKIYLANDGELVNGDIVISNTYDANGELIRTQKKHYTYPNPDVSLDLHFENKTISSESVFFDCGNMYLCLDINNKSKTICLSINTGDMYGKQHEFTITKNNKDTTDNWGWSIVNNNEENN